MVKRTRYYTKFSYSHMIGAIHRTIPTHGFIKHKTKAITRPVFFKIILSNIRRLIDGLLCPICVLLDFLPSNQYEGCAPATGGLSTYNLKFLTFISSSRTPSEYPHT